MEEKGGEEERGGHGGQGYLADDQCKRGGDGRGCTATVAVVDTDLKLGLPQAVDSTKGEERRGEEKNVKYIKKKSRFKKFINVDPSNRAQHRVSYHQCGTETRTHTLHAQRGGSSEFGSTET